MSGSVAELIGTAGTVSRTPEKRMSARAWAIFCLGLAGIAAGTLGIRLASDPSWIKLFDNVHWTCGTIAAAILSWMGWHRSRGTKSEATLFWFALGFTGYAVGQVTWDIQTAVAYARFPSPSDLFYLWLGPGWCVGLYQEIRTRTQRRERIALRLDILSFAVAALTLVLALYLPKRGELELLALAVLVAYPVTLLLACSIGVVMIPALRLKRAPMLWLFLLSADTTAWSWMTWNLKALNATTIDGAWFNVSFSIAILLGGLAAAHWHLDSSPDPAWDRLCEGVLRLVPLLSVVAASGAVILTTLSPLLPAIVPKATMAGSFTVIVLAMIRQVMSLHERDELLEAQEATLRSGALLQSVIDTAPLRVFWKDRQCRYLGCNSAFAADTGVERPQEIIGKADEDLGWQEGAERNQASDREVMESGRAKLWYEESPTTRGGRIWLRTAKIPLRDGKNQVIGVLGVSEDITERRRSETALRESELQMRTLFEESPIGIWEEDFSLAKMRFDELRLQGVTDWRSYFRQHPEETARCLELVKILDVNMSSVRYFGAATKDEIQRNLKNYFLPESLGVFADELAALAEGAERFESEIPLRTPAGQDKILVLTLSVIPSHRETLERVIVTFVDITARKRDDEVIRKLNENLEVRVSKRTADLQQKSAELKDSQAALMSIVEDLNEKTAELETANEELKGLDRLKSLFIASMSHELRTPLNSIIGFSSIMLNEWTGALTAEQSENLAAILRSGKHLLALINDVIDVSKIEAGKIESIAEDFDVGDLVQEAVETFRKDIEHKRLELRVLAPRQVLHADRRRILQCLLNLLSNAVKFTDAGVIEVCSDKSDDGASFEFSVRDTGVGIKGDDIGKLFSPFMRLVSPQKAVIPGTGLGLYLTRKLARDILRGDISVSSIYGTGSRFALRIPLAGQGTEEYANPDRPERG